MGWAVRVGLEGCVSLRKKPERQGPLTSLCVRKTPARSLPIKHRALEDSADSRVSSCEFPDVPASACHPSVPDGRDGPMPGPTLPWGPPQLQGPVASHPHFRWPNTIWAQLKAQLPESRSEEGDTDRVKSADKAPPSTLDLPRKKAHYSGLPPRASPSPLRGLQISLLLLNHPPHALLGVGRAFPTQPRNSGGGGGGCFWLCLGNG